MLNIVITTGTLPECLSSDQSSFCVEQKSQRHSWLRPRWLAGGRQLSQWAPLSFSCFTSTSAWGNLTMGFSWWLTEFLSSNHILGVAGCFLLRRWKLLEVEMTRTLFGDLTPSEEWIYAPAFDHVYSWLWIHWYKM